jgi:signal transduction histidine kinase
VSELLRSVGSVTTGRIPRAGATTTAWRAFAVGAALAYAGGSVVVLERRQARVTSYFAASPTTLMLGLAAGVLVVLGGVVAIVGDPRGQLGPLYLTLGTAWLAPIWVGWEAGPALVRSTAALAAPMLVPVLVHVSMLSPPGQLASDRDRRLVLATYVAFGAVILARAAVYEPFLDRYCWVDCGRGANVFLARSDPRSARGLTELLLVLTMVAGIVAATLSLIRLRRLRMDRGFVVAVTAPAVIGLAAVAAYAVVLLRAPLDHDDRTSGSVTFVVTATALTVLGAWAVRCGVRMQAIRRNVAALTQELRDTPPPGQLQATLARALRDDTLEIRYCLSGNECLVDEWGRPAPLLPDDPRTVATVLRGGRPVAVILHQARDIDAHRLEAELSSMARLVMDNERLSAESLAHLSELRASRSRIVAAADELRRRCERDLHDGAQQRLLAASYELRLARADVVPGDQPETAEELDACIAATLSALGDLREFAHGVFPAVLDEAGLGAALMALADVSTYLVHIEVDNLDRVPASTARAAYALARAAVDAGPMADAIRLRLSCRDGTLTMEVEGARPVDGVHLADRVGAAGGNLGVGSGTVVAVIPCES